MIKILFLAANPSDTTRLRLSEEIRTIDEKLRQTDFRDNFTIQQHGAVRAGDLQGLLLRHKPEIVHFSGHGSLTNEIIIENNYGESHPVTGETLSQLFSIFKEQIRCVVLNACYSELQAKAIAKHIENVIGMSKHVSDSAAISFSSAFYQALGFGFDIRNAYELGCIQISLDNLDETDTPRLLTFSTPSDFPNLKSDAQALLPENANKAQKSSNGLTIAIVELNILSYFKELQHESIGLQISDICSSLEMESRKIVVQALQNMKMNDLVIKTKRGRNAFWHISELGREKLQHLEKTMPFRIGFKREM